LTKTYECMVLLDNREVRQGWEPLKQTVTGTFSKYGANVVSARRWDERPLAYPIRGQSRGTYLLVYYEAEGDANAGIRRDMELSESVLRHMITVCDEIPEEAHQPEAEFDPMAIPEDDKPEPAAEEDTAAKDSAAKDDDAKDEGAKDEGAKDEGGKDDESKDEGGEATAVAEDEAKAEADAPAEGEPAAATETGSDEEEKKE